MKFTHKFVVIDTIDNSIVAYFNKYEDSKEFMDNLKIKRPYNKYEIYSKKETND